MADAAVSRCAQSRARSQHSRRSILAGISALAAPVAVDAAPPTALPVEALISAHRAADETAAEAAGAEDFARQAHRKAYAAGDPLVPLLVTGGGVEMSSEGYAFDYIRGCYEKLRQFFGRSDRFACPAEDLIKIIDELEAKNLEIATGVIAENERRRAQFRLPELEERKLQTAQEAERRLLALCEHRCESVEEIRLRAAYLDAEVDVDDEVSLAVMRSMLP